MKNRHDFIIFVYQQVGFGFVAHDHEGRKRELMTGDRLYAVDGILYFHDKFTNTLIRLEVSLKEFRESEYFAMFIEI